MSGRTDTILRVCEILSEAKNLRISYNESKGVENYNYNFGGLCGPKMNLLTSELTTSKIKPVQKVIREDLTYRQKADLTNRIDAFLTNVKMTDARKIATTILEHPRLSVSITNTIINYLSYNLRMQVV